MPGTLAVPLNTSTLRLERLSGPPVDPIEIGEDKVTYAGRGAECDVRLEHEYVSRRHFSITHRGGVWFIADEGSRHGTYVDEIRLRAHEPMPLAEGQIVRVEPWTFVVRSTDSPRTTLATNDDLDQNAERVEILSAADRAPIAQRRLDVLIQCAGSLATVNDERSLAECILGAVFRGTGFARGAILRRLGPAEEVEVVHGVGLGGDERGAAVSRSLLRAAASGDIALLTSTDTTPVGAESIVRLGIHSAVCAPIHLGSTLFGFLYLDSRSEEARTEREVATFCQALARMCGMALATIRGREAEHQRRQLEADLVAAREAQGFIMPPGEGRIGDLEYAVRMKPGRFVAGDLFDVVAMTDGRVAVFLGDVTGKGVGAGILMATTQTFLHATLQQQSDPAAALRIVNRHLVQHSAHNVFVSLWLGVFDVRERVVRFVDAGHGHWLVRPANLPPQRFAARGGPLLGIDADFEYPVETAPLEPGGRVILFSDGVVEQLGTTGEMYGLDRAIAALEGSRGAAEDVAALFAAVERFAGGASLADDTTIASIESRA